VHPRAHGPLGIYQALIDSGEYKADPAQRHTAG